MKIYLAARYSRRTELVDYRADLTARGAEVTSRWLNGDHQIDNSGTPIGESGEALVEGSSPDGAALREHFAQEDVADVMRADMLIAFTEQPRVGPSRGGRWVEFGLAIALGIPMVVIGPRENLFTWLPEIQQFDSWSDYLNQMINA